MPHALISLYLTSLSLLPLFHSLRYNSTPRTCCLSAYLYNSILNNSSVHRLRLFRCQNPSFLPIAFSYSPGNIVPCACVRVSLTCSLFRYNVFFFRDRHRALTRTTFVSHSPLLHHLLVSLYEFCSARCFVLPARGHSPDRPSLSDPFPGSTFGTVAATSSVILSTKNIERACLSGWRTLVNPRPTSKMFS